ncbi:amidase family protein [Stylonychia lemnae]|uniref:Amidase family protein n=1 Tax=Stylonychia lemnae TaxID=5949 RepID=A0A078AM54_STYLE|nr:amidase family protein [Stylonychia lemnae]|eukprot:CDW81908.1 amidase family protein [Stylonychia lemnae]
MFKRDYHIAKMPFDDQKLTEVQNRKLKIGYFDDIPTLASCKSNKRAINIAKQKLEQLGHNLIPFNLKQQQFDKMKQIEIPTFYLGLGKQLQSLFYQNYEYILPMYRLSNFFMWINSFHQWIIKLITKPLGKRITMPLHHIKEYSTFQLDSLYCEKIKLMDELNNQIEEMGLDAIICPGYPTAAYKNQDCIPMGFQMDYYSLFNFLKYPVGAIPVTEVLEGEDQDYSDNFNDMNTKSIKKSLKGSTSLPIGIQVSAPKWKDEQCLQIMRILEQAIGFKKTPIKYYSE